MTPDGLHRSRSRLVVSALTASLMAFLLFSLNVLYGKFAPSFGWDTALSLRRVPEFWLLFVSGAFFVVAALAAERQASADSPPAHTNLEEHSDEKRQESH